MAIRKNSEIKDLDTETIVEEIKSVQASLSKMYFDHASKGLEAPQVLKQTRKEVARLHTELRIRQISEMSVEQLAERSKTRLRRKSN